MAAVAVSTQLNQWSFEKPSRPERSDSAASSPDLSHNEPDTLRIHTPAVHDAATVDSQDDDSFQKRYLSSEEDLSPMDGNSSEEDYDSDVSIHEARPNLLKARTMSISRWDKGKSCDMAVTVSYVSAGRPKMIQLATSPVIETAPIREPPKRTVSLAQMPMPVLEKLRLHDQQTRHSLIVKPTTSRSSSPPSITERRRPSTGSGAYAHSNKSAVLLSDSASGSSSQSVRSSSRSSSPSVSEKSTHSMRPVSAAGLPRSSLYVVTSARAVNPHSPFPPLTPQSPDPHAFLSSDPYENSTTNAASPIIKNAPHKRLRAISQRLSLAKIAISPSTKKWDSRVNGKSAQMPLTPSTPFTPLTPQTAPLPSATSMNKLRRNSRLLSRPGTPRGPAPDAPPMPTVNQSSPRKTSSRMVARGADEREPILELPPCPTGAAPADGLKTRRLKKRKSLMDLL